MSFIYVRAHSHQTGIAFAKNDTETLTVVVLPKTWNEQNTLRSRFLWGDKDSQGVFVLFENQIAQIQLGCEEEIIQTRRELFNTLLITIEDSTEQSDAQLLQESSYTRFISGGFEIIEEPLEAMEAIQQILHLLLLVQRTSPKQFSSIHTSSVLDEMLAPLLHQMFLDEIGKYIQKLRRGYVGKSETLNVLRGRPDSLSIGTLEEGGGSSLLCHFEDFVVATPISRVLVTALDIVTTGTWLSHFGGKHSFAKNIQKEGLQFRRYLHSIPSYSVVQALSVLKNIRFNKLNRNLQRSVELAKSILSQQMPLFSKLKIKNDDAWFWYVDMSDVWEKILVQAFSKIHKIQNQVVHYDHWRKNKEVVQNSVFPYDISGPFENTPDRLPDILLKFGSQNWIIDAKYSFYPKIKNKPSRNNQYQMFVYAYLTKENQETWVNDMALIYVTNGAPQSLKGSNINGWNGSKIPRLHQFSCTFPRPSNIISLNEWEGYMRELSVQLEESLVKF